MKVDVKRAKQVNVTMPGSYNELKTAYLALMVKYELLQADNDRLRAENENVKDKAKVIVENEWKKIANQTESDLLHRAGNFCLYALMCMGYKVASGRKFTDYYNAAIAEWSKMSVSEETSFENLGVGSWCNNEQFENKAKLDRCGDEWVIGKLKSEGWPAFENIARLL